MKAASEGATQRKAPHDGLVCPYESHGAIWRPTSAELGRLETWPELRLELRPERRALIAQINCTCVEARWGNYTA
eukprot:835266-Alexandrium_andersonii.AAC.1